MHTLFCRKNVKNVLQKEIKDWTFKAYLLNADTSSWFPLIESLKITYARTYGGSWIFTDCFSWHVLPKLSEITVICSKSVKENKKGQFWLAQSLQNEYQLWTAQSHQNDQFENLYISSHREARNIKFTQQVNIVESVPLGTPPQAVVMTLAHNYVTNLFISSYRGATVIKFGQ